MLTCKVLQLEPSRVQGSGQPTVKGFGRMCSRRLALALLPSGHCAASGLQHWGLCRVHHHWYHFGGSSSHVRPSSRRVSACLLLRHSWPSSLSSPHALLLLNDVMLFLVGVRTHMVRDRPSLSKWDHSSYSVQGPSPIFPMAGIVLKTGRQGTW